MMAVTGLLILASHVETLSHRHACISLSNSFHIGVRPERWDSCIVFYNDFDYGPYRGSIIALIDSKGNTHPPFKRKVGIGETFGFYYRYFSWKDSTPTLWTLSLSLWYVLVLFAILPLGRLLWWTLRPRPPSLW